MPLMELANRENGPTAFTDDSGKSYILGPPGGTAYPETVRVSTEMLEDAGLLSALESGSIQVVNPSDEVAETLSHLRLDERRQTVLARRSEAAQAVELIMDRKRNRDMVGNTCIGPKGVGRSGACGASIIQSSQEVGQVPPLCQAHQHLALMFVATERGSRGSKDDPLRTEWIKIAAD